MSIHLKMSSDKLDNEDLQTLTRELCEQIKRETDIDIQLVQNKADNSKSDLILLGELAITFLSSYSGKALLDIIKARIMRESSLSIG